MGTPRRVSRIIITDHGSARIFERLGCKNKTEALEICSRAFNSLEPLPKASAEGTYAYAVTRKTESIHEWLAYRYFRGYIFIFSEYFNPDTLTRQLKLITVYVSRPDNTGGRYKSRPAGRGTSRTFRRNRRLQNQLDS